MTYETLNLKNLIKSSI